MQKKPSTLRHSLERAFHHVQIPPEIRNLIDSTNAIENSNRQLHKVTKTKSAFVSDDLLMKILYLAAMSIVDKWTMPHILARLSIYFGERVHFQL